MLLDGRYRIFQSYIKRELYNDAMPYDVGPPLPAALPLIRRVHLKLVDVLL